MTFLINNMGTIITALILIIAVALVIRVMIRDKKAGKGLLRWLQRLCTFLFLPWQYKSE